MRLDDKDIVNAAEMSSTCTTLIVVLLLLCPLNFTHASSVAGHHIMGLNSATYNRLASSPDSIILRIEGERDGLVLRWVAPPLFSCLTYEVERAWTPSFSATAEPEWKQIGTVPGICNVSEYIPYSYVDPLTAEISAGRIRYRLSGETLGGWKFEFYSEDHLLALPNRIELVDLYPLPATQILTVTIAVQQPQTASMQVFSSAGRRVLRLAARLKGGVSTQTLDIASLPAGPYVLEIRTRNDALRKTIHIIR